MKRKEEPQKEKREGRYLNFQVLTSVSLILFVIFAGGEVKAGSEEGRLVKNSGPEVRATLKREVAEYRYDPANRPDPFKPFIAPTPLEEKGVGLIPSTPLQKFDVSQLNLVGIIWGIEDNKAILEDSTGKGYIVSIGTYIGKKGGKVSGIEKDKIIIKEKFRDYLGNIRTKETPVKLRKLEGEGR